MNEGPPIDVLVAEAEPVCDGLAPVPPEARQWLAVRLWDELDRVLQAAVDASIAPPRG
ncbi:hypothetical protein PO587_44615 [Streptomyces gilvifuscus]|uniref:Uncharacterized protein n=1 Tax=Streptomyces gilvifuscus TaxID=1550617 RepID=A0ABT5G9H7_9ACTN|nr:hypothetical protein [Streptomyces gilvifuscus]MDC2961521.1 hypothetical protein [Streptomyces gilvifuscus]